MTFYLEVAIIIAKEILRKSKKVNEMHSKHFKCSIINSVVLGGSRQINGTKRSEKQTLIHLRLCN